eukprot:NODE_1826_length_2365_cov_9.028150.p1 GENE.NODE_1826_length_2365_cov_9.028150~~NODE_1826_length_2365_cov_9.028150.p1  ORF type:complete len:654 (+),score=144.69 NODE_1826_length_2365_cov_9.028150:66-2027(+)
MSWPVGFGSVRCCPRRRALSSMSQGIDKHVAAAAVEVEGAAADVCSDGAASDDSGAGNCQICLQCLEPGATSEEGMVVRLACGHSFHGCSCLAPYVRHVFLKAERNMQANLEEHLGALDLQGEARQQLLNGRSFREIREAGQLRQCPRCSYGPVLNTHCSDLHLHDASRGSALVQDSTTNECPNCGFYSAQWGDWSIWDPEDLMAAARCPLCRSPCKLALGEIAPVQAMLATADERLEEASRVHAGRRMLGEDFCSILAILWFLLEDGTGTDGNGTPRQHGMLEGDVGFTHVLEMVKVPERAAGCLQGPMLDQLRQRLEVEEAALAARSAESAGAPRSAACGRSTLSDRFPDGDIPGAINAVRLMMPVDERIALALERHDFMLCLDFTEKQKEALEEVIRPIARPSSAVAAALRPLRWNPQAGSFAVYPSLETVLQVLEACLPSWCLPSAAANCVPYSPALASAAVPVARELSQLILAAVGAALRGGPQTSSLEQNCEELMNSRNLIALLLCTVRESLDMDTARRLGKPWKSSIVNQHGLGNLQLVLRARDVQPEVSASATIETVGGGGHILRLILHGAEGVPVMRIPAYRTRRRGRALRSRFSRLHLFHPFDDSDMDAALSDTGEGVDVLISEHLVFLLGRVVDAATAQNGL